MKRNFLPDLSNQSYDTNTRYSLMGIAMILVVMFHVSQHDEYDNSVQKIMYYIFGHGWVGVDMFFLLSTYGLSFSYNNNELLRFYKNRIRRIVPLYALSLIICHIESKTDIIIALEQFSMQITGLAIFNDTKDILWYMEALVLLYIFFPLFYKLTCKVFKCGVFVYATICVLIHLSLIFIDDYCLQLMVKRIPVMMLGVITFLCDKEYDWKKHFVYYGVISLIAIMPLVEDMFFYVPAILIFFGRSKILNNLKFLAFIGRHSLEIFIAHHFALWGFNYFFGMNYYLLIFLVLCLIILFSIVAFKINKLLNLLLDKFYV